MKLALAALLLPVLIGVAYATSGPQAAIGMSMGLFGTIFNIAALWGVIRLMAQSIERQPASKIGGCLLVVGLFVKLPLIIGLGMFCMKLGPTALNAFLIGLGVVYSALAAYAVSDGLRKAEQERSRR